MTRLILARSMMVVAVIMAAMCALADAYVPPPRVMSQVEWFADMNRHSIPLRLSIPCSALVVLLVALGISVRRKRPSIMVWLASCAPVVLFLPIAYGEPWFDIFFFSILVVSVVSWLASMLFYFRMRKFAKVVYVLFASPFVFVVLAIAGVTVNHLLGTSSMFGVYDLNYSHPVETKPYETYNEYVKRANRIIFHHCPKCDKPMKSGYCFQRYWYCDACGYNKDFEERRRREMESTR